MNDRAKLKKTILSFFFLCLPILFSQTGLAATTPTMIIEEAKVAIEEARKAGAERVALDDFMAGQSWLSQAEKEYEARKSLLARTKRIVSSDQAKEEEIIYLGTVAKLKAMTAEAKAKTDTTLVQLKQAQRELADYQDAVENLKKKLAEGEKAKEAQAKADEERKALEEIKQQSCRTRSTEKEGTGGSPKESRRDGSLQTKGTRGMPFGTGHATLTKRTGAVGSKIEDRTTGRTAGQRGSRIKGLRGKAGDGKGRHCRLYRRKRRP